MDSDKLIAKYRILKFFIDVVDISLSLLIAILVYGIPTMIFIALVHLTNLLNPILVILVLYLFILVFFYDMYDSKIRSFIEYLSISDRLFNHYMTKWNTSEDQIKYLIKEKKAEAKRKKYMEPERRLLRNEIDITKPLIYQLCMLNPGGIEAQKEFLKDIYDADTILHIVSSSSYCIEPHLNSVYKKWRLKEVSERRKMVNFLFKLAIVQDGIHLDEWNFLIKLMGEFRFSQALMSFYINRYSALRTEFEESEWEDNESSSTTGRNSNVDLNPYYAILGLDDSASVKEIKKAYHALALQYHPDLPKNANRIKECEEMMAKINEAYEKIIK